MTELLTVEYWRGNVLLETWVAAYGFVPSFSRLDLEDIDRPDRVTWTAQDGTVVREFQRCHGWAVRSDQLGWVHFDNRQKEHG